MKKSFTKEGFSIIENETKENKLLNFLKENYPQTIRDNEVKLDELKNALGLPFDEKVNGYGLNFVGRNVANAKYKQKTEKELKINKDFSKDFNNTQNMLLKGDNLDCLKILKNYYNGKIKCIYIDPPYNTDSDNFVYPDKFDKEEAEVLGLANISENDFERMEFSFNTKKSHNGWLSFMYPRLMLARDLLSNDGVIFISIDDNEQANLKLLCDEIFGEENFVGEIAWHKNYASANDSKKFSNVLDYILVYQKSDKFARNLLPRTAKQDSLYKYDSNDGMGLWRSDNLSVKTYSKEYDYPITNPNTNKIYNPPKGRCWITNKNTIQEWIEKGKIFFGQDGNGAPQLKRYLNEVQQGVVPITYWSYEDCGHNDEARKELKALFENPPFDTPKPTRLIKQILRIGTDKDSIILDFFAGSGTTGHAVMQLNAEDGGNRKFILCQINEPVSKDKPAYNFCVENNLPPVISSITCERLKRAGEKIVVSEKWLVDRGGKEYGCTKLQGINSVAESNGSNRDNLQIGKKITERGNLFALRPDEASSGINTEQHSRGTGTPVYKGIHSFSANSTGEQSGIENATSIMYKDQLPCKYGYYGSDEPSTRNKQNGECPHFQTKNCPLTTTHYPLDLGFKVFDLAEAPKLELEENSGQININYNNNDPLSRIYNMVLSVGIDNPTSELKEIVKDCMYSISASSMHEANSMHKESVVEPTEATVHYYITNAEILDKAESKHFLAEAIKTGKVYIDGWTASINTTLQNYKDKDDVKIVF